MRITCALIKKPHRLEPYNPTKYPPASFPALSDIFEPEGAALSGKSAQRDSEQQRLRLNYIRTRNIPETISTLRCLFECGLLGEFGRGDSA